MTDSGSMINFRDRQDCLASAVMSSVDPEALSDAMILCPIILLLRPTPQLQTSKSSLKAPKEGS